MTWAQSSVKHFYGKPLGWFRGENVDGEDADARLQRKIPNLDNPGRCGQVKVGSLGAEPASGPSGLQ